MTAFLTLLLVAPAELPSLVELDRFPEPLRSACADRGGADDSQGCAGAASRDAVG